MSIEIKYLAWSIALGLVYVLVAASLGTAQRGLDWNVGNRDGEPKPLTGAAARAHRASWNFLETFPFFAAAVLVVVLTKTNTAHTGLGAMLYAVARSYAGMASMVRDDKATAEADRSRLAERYAAQAVQLLDKARADGYFASRPNRTKLKDDVELGPLRARPDFKKLLNQVGP